jgi:hypothetical protein
VQRQSFKGVTLLLVVKSGQERTKFQPGRDVFDKSIIQIAAQ